MPFIPQGVRLIYLFGLSCLLYIIGTMIFIAIGSAIVDKIDKMTSKMEEI